ncbi:uncharacterized protein LOC136747244 [Amia ocellicauda]|uniref:uncharacterized protein LOC136747244 n=1 Tax=Amia ocellicauda TaxID=2972642 RepID=UPI0034646BB4
MANPSMIVPDMTIETNMTCENETEFREVKCKAVKGRPAATITWLGINLGDIREIVEKDNDTETVTSIYRFLPNLHEGENISCVITHPKNSTHEVKTISLPVYYLSSIYVLNAEVTNTKHAVEKEILYRVVLEAGQQNQTIPLQVSGNVPHYEVKCIKENDSHPSDVNVIDHTLWIEGPVEKRHAGNYMCRASYYSKHVSVQLEVEVTSFQPVPPIIRTEMMDKREHRIIECVATDSIPPANISWILPANLTGVTVYSSSFENGTHSTVMTLQLPVYTPHGYNITCEIEHPAFKDKQARTIFVPPSFTPYITIQTTKEYKEESEYTAVECRAVTSIPASNITWHLVNSKSGEITVGSVSHENGTQTVVSVFRFPTPLLSGQDVACVVEHPSLPDAVTRIISLPSISEY